MADKPFIEKFRNPDGSYNGVAAIHDLTKLLYPKSDISQAEIDWTFRRMKVLIQGEKKSKDEAKAIVREEAKGRPWLKE